MTEFYWPLGKEGDRALVVLGEEEADLLAPILDGEPEPEDGSLSERLVPIGIPGLDVSPEELAHELTDGPRDVWLVLPYSKAVDTFHAALSEAMDAAGWRFPAGAFIPEPLTLKDIIDSLPSGREAVDPDRPTRHRLLKEVMWSLWIASAPDDWLAPLILSQAGGIFYPEQPQTA